MNKIFAGGLAIMIGTVISVYLMSLKRRRKMRSLPEVLNWTQVGTLSELLIYPLKSGRYVDLQFAECTPIGLKEIVENNKLYPRRDRCFIVLKENTKEMITARTYPTLLKITVEPNEKSEFVFKHPDKEDLIINLEDLSSHESGCVRMWSNEPVVTVDCGEKAAEWITGIISKDSKKYRIGHWKDSYKGRRNIISPNKDRANAFQELSNMDSGAYSDMASYMLMTSSSLDDLNLRINNGEISCKQFRPNFFVKISGKPFDEDKWNWIKIGENAIFKNVKPCTRCTLTTIHPETCIRHPRGEPLKTLKKYRQLEDENERKSEGDSPVMGINLGLYQPGKVSVGDPVYVIY